MKNCVHVYILPTIRMIPGSPNAIVQARHLAFAQGPQFSSGQVTQVRTGWIILVVPWEVHSDPAWKTTHETHGPSSQRRCWYRRSVPKTSDHQITNWVCTLHRENTHAHTHTYIYIYIYYSIYNVFIHIYIHIIYAYNIYIYSIYIRNSIHNSTHPPPLPLNFCQDIG